jgi:predicted amino acid dehydrogenase
VDPTRTTHPHRALLHNVGHGISRTGANLKDVAGAVLTTPFDIAKSVKRNVFGSADNIATVVEEGIKVTFILNELL